MLFNIFMSQTLTDDFGGLHKNMNCTFPLTIKIPERRQWRHFVVFIVTFEHISHLFLVLLLLPQTMLLFSGYRGLDPAFLHVKILYESLKTKRRVWINFPFLNCLIKKTFFTVKLEHKYKRNKNKNNNWKFSKLSKLQLMHFALW